MPDLDCRIDARVPHRLLGRAATGAYAVYPQYLGSSPLIYSGGLGHQIDFEIDAISYYGASVVGFDPTAQSAKYLRLVRPDNFHFFNCALSDRDDTASFRVQKPNAKFYSSVCLGEEAYTPGPAADGSYRKHVEVFPVRRLPTIARQLGHREIDLLKIDIEGAEYRVIDDILKCGLLPLQIAMEWHPRQIGEGNAEAGIEYTNQYIKKLRSAGYLLCHAGPKPTEMTFVHSRCLPT